MLMIKKIDTRRNGLAPGPGFWFWASNKSAADAGGDAARIVFVTSIVSSSKTGKPASLRYLTGEKHSIINQFKSR